MLYLALLGPARKTKEKLSVLALEEISQLRVDLSLLWNKLQTEELHGGVGTA